MTFLKGKDNQSEIQCLFFTLTLKVAKLKEFKVMETSSTASKITLINNRKANLKGKIILSPNSFSKWISSGVRDKRLNPDNTSSLIREIFEKMKNINIIRKFMVKSDNPISRPPAFAQVLFLVRELFK